MAHTTVKLTGLKKAFLEAVPKKSGSVVGTVWSNIQMARMKGVSLPMRRAAIPKLKAAMTKALDELVESGKLVRTPHRDGSINPFNQIHHPKKGKKRNPAGHTVSGQGRVDAALLEFASGRRPADMNGLIDMGYMEHKHGTGMVLSLKGRKRLAQIKKSGIGGVKKTVKKSVKKNGSCTYSAALPEYCIEVVGENQAQAKSIRDALERGIQAAADICKMRPSVCRGNLGLTRDRMPQITGDANMLEMLEGDDKLDQRKAKAIGQAGGKKSNHQTIQQQFLDWLETKGIRTKRERVRVGELMATQSEIKAAKAYSMANAHLRGDFPTIDKQIVISKDGYILDGHHRWAALLTLDPGRWMSVLRVGLPMFVARNGGPTLLGEAAAFPGVYKANFAGEPLTQAAQKKYKRDHKSQLGRKPAKRKAAKKPSDVLARREERLMHQINNLDQLQEKKKEQYSSLMAAVTRAQTPKMKSAALKRVEKVRNYLFDLQGKEIELDRKLRELKGKLAPWEGNTATNLDRATKAKLKYL